MAKKISITKWLKRLFYLSIFLFLTTNFVIYNHAYYFTHFVDKDLVKVTSQEVNKKDFSEKIKLGIFGVEIGKPKNKIVPDSSFEVVTFGSQPQLHAWLMPTSQAPKGVIILFHGYSACKSSQLDCAYFFQKLGYHTFLVDFRGHGDSEGFQTSIGYHEAADVKAAYQYIKTYYNLPISLMGTSMGAVAVLKAMHDDQLDVKKIIVECPFRSLSDAVLSRFENMKLPTILLPDLLLFWGGYQNNMSSWEHNTVNYAKKISTPTLVLYGQHDEKVRRHEVDDVFHALAGKRQLKVLENAGHDHMMANDSEEWGKVVWAFLES